MVRAILEAYYEPQFSDHSHGFRPGRGCHSALQRIKRVWHGPSGSSRGIKGCFCNINHVILLDILREGITDNRFLRLIQNILQAGYLEEWRVRPHTERNATGWDGQPNPREYLHGS